MELSPVVDVRAFMLVSRLAEHIVTMTWPELKLSSLAKDVHALHAGSRARELGDALLSCPFPRKTWFWVQWRSGWMQEDLRIRSAQIAHQSEGDNPNLIDLRHLLRQ